MDLHQRTLDDARGLLKSTLRRSLYAAKAEKAPTASWMALKDVEEGFVRAHREAWKETLTSWNLTDATARQELETLVEQALDQASRSAIEHFLGLNQSADWASSEVDTFKAEFDFGAFIGVPGA